MKHLPQLLLLTFIISVLIPFIPKPYILITLGNAHQTSTFAYVLLPVICIFALCESAIRKQRLENISFTVTGIFVGLLLVLIGALFIIVRAKLEFYSISEYRPPLNEAFYGIQLLGLLGALLTTYVRSLPKTE